MPKYTIDTKTAEQIERCFTYHSPKPDQPERYVAMRDQAKALAVKFAECCPPSRELSRALTHLEDAVMCANAAIARHE